MMNCFKGSRQFASSGIDSALERSSQRTYILKMAVFEYMQTIMNENINELANATLAATDIYYLL